MLAQQEQRETRENREEPLLFHRLSDNAMAPRRGTPLAAGFDLASAYDGIVPARGKWLAKTDLAIVLPKGTYGRLAPRSGLAWKYALDVGAGVIDADYRGNVGVILFNHSDEEFVVHQGDRVAQLILEQVSMVDAVECNRDQLETTERGEGGYGSTGLGAR